MALPMATPPSIQGLASARLADPNAGAAPAVQSAPAAPTDPKDVDPTDPDYEGPEDGPFQCDNCTFYQDPNQCTQPAVMTKLKGVVDPSGCCKFFTTLSGPGSKSVPNTASSQVSEGNS